MTQPRNLPDELLGFISLNEQNQAKVGEWLLETLNKYPDQFEAFVRCFSLKIRHPDEIRTFSDDLLITVFQLARYQFLASAEWMARAVQAEECE